MHTAGLVPTRKHGVTCHETQNVIDTTTEFPDSRQSHCVAQYYSYLASEIFFFNRLCYHFFTFS